ncbi:DUF2807 domain-containing protein [Flammeovirga sp. SubArs3]|uniref:GIN domain-containing protein n=1 Tax=Flammeovirga sp. SubArs3 TaxID=2995316 RepID=UPI00248BEDCA|nr:DUF2807 domain-containing protein [Flammeovirga sp. SubArs3]
MKNFLILLFSFFALVSCRDKGTYNTSPIPYFSKVIVKDNVKLRLAYSEQQKFFVEGDDSLFTINHSVEDGILILDNSGSEDIVVANLGSGELDSIVVEGSGEIEFTKPFVFYKGKLNLVLKDNGIMYSDYIMEGHVLNVEMKDKTELSLRDLDIVNLYIDQKDQSLVTMEGTADKQYISLKDKSQYNGINPLGEAFEPIIGKVIDIETNNSANAWVNATDTLKAQAKDKSTITFIENEKTVVKKSGESMSITATKK